MLKSLLTSKKFLAAVLACVAWLLGKLGLHLDNDELLGAVLPLWTYVIGQAIADHGKESAKATAGMATSPTATSSPTTPRDSQAGCSRLHLVIGIGLAVLLTVPFWAACDTRATIQHAKQEIIDCGRAEVRDLAADLAPAVGAILTGDTPSWRAQLDALLGAGTHAGACAIRAVGGELAARAAAVVTGAHAEGQEATGAAHAREYLAARGFVFEVAQ